MRFPPNRLLPILLFLASPAAGGPLPHFVEGKGGTQILLGGKPVMTYVHDDPAVRRPYFKDLRTLGGIRVTRPQPPAKGPGGDHPTMHPGLWLALGDLSGVDFWRNQGRVVLGKGREEKGCFHKQHLYLDGKGARVATEDLTVQFTSRPEGVMLHWTSEFRPVREELIFGDQEEMGLGVRLAPSLTVSAGGGILDAEGRRDGKGIWGKSSRWCEYFGKVQGRRVGVVIMPHPDNFRPCWWHARDYGLLVANPFGRRAFTREAPSRVVVAKGKSLPLRFGILIYEVGADRSPAAGAYADYLKSEKQR